jgi:aspartate racemase
MIKTKLAILGLGSRTTSFYLKQLNNMYNREKGGYSTCPFLLLNTDFNTINSLLPYVSEKLDDAVSQYTEQIISLNVDYLLVPNITLHETIDRLDISQNILHPVHLSIKKIKKNKWNKIVLFGSLFSMKSDYIKNQFKANRIEVLLPNEEDMVFIDEVRKHIYNEIETDDLIRKYHSIIHKYTEENPVILSCTELSILKPIEHKMLLDMAEIQMEAAVKQILA